MPENRIEPLFIPRQRGKVWPRCGESIVALFGVTLTCELPRYHDRDGAIEHRDASGARWTELADE